MMNVLVIDDLHPVFMEDLQSAGYQVLYRPEITREEALEIIHDFEIIAVRSKFDITREVMDKALKLQCIARAGAGMDNIDEAYARERGIVCLNAPEGNRDAVAEHAVGMLLDLFRNISKSDQEVRSGIWDRESNRGVELNGKTLGLIGYGNTGKSFARKLSGFDMNILAYDKYLYNYSDSYAKEVSLDTLYKEADILSFHIPLTPDTKYWVNDAFTQTIKKPVYLVNTSRGQVISTSSLIEGLNSGRILGAALDVLENERLDHFSEEERSLFTQLKSMRNVVLTSHIAGWTRESYYKISKILSLKIITRFTQP